MDKRPISTVSLVGSGNLAHHVAVGFHAAGITIKEIWSKDHHHAAGLAELVKADVCTRLENLERDVDLVIISIKDDAIEEALKLIPKDLPAIVHTSGSVDMKVLSLHANNMGVFYPVQSFNKKEAMDWKKVPICVEANNDEFTEMLFNVSKKLSDQVEYLNSTQRIQLHMAAIFVNNFSNYLFALAYDLVTKQHLPFSLLIPLIKQTAERLDQSNPALLQTGPAKRKDEAVIRKHLELLEGNPEAKEVYEFLSNQIIKKDGGK